MYEEITPEFVRECTDALEFFDENNCLPWERRKVTFTLSAEAIEKLKGKNKSKAVEDALNYIN